MWLSMLVIPTFTVVRVRQEGYLMETLSKKEKDENSSRILKKMIWWGQGYVTQLAECLFA